MPEYGVVGVFAFLGILFVGGALLVSWLVGYSSPETVRKRITYECGEETIGTVFIQYRTPYTMYALVFLVFAVESMFLFPCLAVFRDLSQGRAAGPGFLTLMAEIFLFLLVFFAGLLYAWKKGALKWE